MRTKLKSVYSFVGFFYVALFCRSYFVRAILLQAILSSSYFVGVPYCYTSSADRQTQWQDLTLS